MSVLKEPLTALEFDRILEVATRSSEEAKKIILFFRYTGMHVSILANPKKYKLRVEEDEIIWDRTKKTGRIARTSIPISKNLDFNVKSFIEDLKTRRRRCSRQYFYDIVKRIGNKAGIKELSPMSFRHTLGASLSRDGYDEDDIMQILNCSRRTVKTYKRHTPKTLKEKMRKKGW